MNKGRVENASIRAKLKRRKMTGGVRHDFTIADIVNKKHATIVVCPNLADNSIGRDLARSDFRGAINSTLRAFAAPAAESEVISIQSGFRLLSRDCAALDQAYSVVSGWDGAPKRAGRFRRFRAWRLINLNGSMRRTRCRRRAADTERAQMRRLWVEFFDIAASSLCHGRTVLGRHRSG